MEWVSLGLGAVGTLAGIGGLVLGWLSWRRSGDALRETRWSPIRQAQHALLPELGDWAASLKALLEDRINFDVQQSPLKREVLATDADNLHTLVTQMTEPEVVDDELQSDLVVLRSLVLSTNSERTGLVSQLGNLVAVAEEIEQTQGSINTEQLLGLGARRGQSVEITRSVNAEALEVLQAIQSRLRVLARLGLGDSPTVSKRTAKAIQP